MEPTFSSIVSIVGHRVSDCGYCHSSHCSYKYGLWAHQLSCEDYQALMDRGWRRSGKYLYKPDLEKGCCPQYTIRLPANRFVPTKSQRAVLSKFNRYIEGTWAPSSDPDAHKDKRSVINEGQHSLTDKIHAPEKDSPDFRFKLQIVLEPSSFTQDKYQLFRKYQINVHHDLPSKISPASFRRFLVDTPLKLEPSEAAVTYGSFHQCYMLDGKLIAMAVLDILPNCVSSVYFMYDTDYAFLGLGNYSALREISLVQELSQKSSRLQWYYMGYYIHSCEKMKYKGQFKPSELLDPVTYEWYPIEDCKPKLDRCKFVVFSDQSRPRGVPPGWLDPNQVTANDLNQVVLKLGQDTTHDDTIVPLPSILRFLDDAERKSLLADVREFIAAVGRELSKRLVLQ